ncbi:FIST signal transduction protein [Ferruginibacter sp. SUN106]|uniref:FIST signal transduction protein n=1 Tax=Ferruginibacter sp. SUN106 TaxID=2978348 RepID=UPI003D360B95
MNAKSIKGKSAEEIKLALDQSLADGFKPTLAVMFISKKHNHKIVIDLLNDAGIAIFGATTNGEFIDGDTGMGNIAILLMDINPAYFTILTAEFPAKNYREISNQVAKEALRRFSNPAFLISCSHTETDAEQLLLGFEDIVGAHVNVYGGAAGDDYTFSEQLVFSNAFQSDRGVVALVLDEDKIKIKGRATCGWHAVGTVRTVTKSEGNHVYTVDDIPVLDLTAKYGGIQNVSPDNGNLILEIASTFPLQMQREKGNPVMRPGLLIDWNDRSFYCSGSVPQGSKVRFSLPPDFDVVDKVINGVEEMKAIEMPDADAVIVFSCAGRQVALGPMIHQEMEGIKNVWNVPMAGMFSNAELGRATGGNLEMHNLTTCCVALKER